MTTRRDSSHVSLARTLDARHQDVQHKACPNSEGCGMYPMLSLAGTLKTWKTRYCESQFETCERYKRAAAGRAVAPDLMPNGVRLSERNR